mmetsp:Transcript_31062/g.85053  ORF Transcript_31062/g.85053 Transcript_31062/m.85053 type:complete len:203 (-) Transcript_31062:812-1420(-)
MMIRRKAVQALRNLMITIAVIAVLADLFLRFRVQLGRAASVLCVGAAPDVAIRPPRHLAVASYQAAPLQRREGFFVITAIGGTWLRAGADNEGRRLLLGFHVNVRDHATNVDEATSLRLPQALQLLLMWHLIHPHAASCASTWEPAFWSSQVFELHQGHAIVARHPLTVRLDDLTEQPVLPNLSHKDDVPHTNSKPLFFARW